MPIPEAFPMLRPFGEAVAYQLERVPMTSDEFYRLDDEAKRRGFTIAGLTREASLREAHRLASVAIAAGRTKQEFLDELADLLDLEGSVLPRPRLQLIAQNNTAAAYAAGRWAQLADPELRVARPYLQYPLGPSDEKTSAICRKLEGFVARYDHPAWQRIFPPNHHNERHIQVTSLTEEQARATGRLYEGGEEDQYPHLEGQTILPDPGFDAPPQMLAADESFFTERAARAGEAISAKTPADYELLAFEEIPRASLPAAPKFATTPIAAEGGAEEYERAWNAFRSAVGIPEGARSTMVLDEFGGGVAVTRGTFEHLVGLDAGAQERLAKRDRPRWFSFIRPTIEDPFEAWMVVRRNADGELTFARRYFGLYDTGAKRRQFVVWAVDLSPDGWLMDSAQVRSGDLEGLRRGLLLKSKARRSGR